jgi:hypothetical protein
MKHKLTADTKLAKRTQNKKSYNRVKSQKFGSRLTEISFWKIFINETIHLTILDTSTEAVSYIKMT